MAALLAKERNKGKKRQTDVLFERELWYVLAVYHSYFLYPCDVEFDIRFWVLAVSKNFPV